MYVYYLYYDLKSASFDHKKLTKTIQKSLFASNEQLHVFEKIVADLIKDKDLKKALAGLPEVYVKKRKKIMLDEEYIKDVQTQHAGTVDLLNEYLSDDFEDEVTKIRSEQVGSSEIAIQITQKSNSGGPSPFQSDISFSQVQMDLLELFVKNSFALPQTEIDIFAKSNGVFMNQIIDRINEGVFEYLNDNLIEEEEDSFVMNPEYYNNILAK
jgi:hypothetical protein